MRETKINPLVMDILTSDEVAALSLQYVDDKSSWESGTILGKAHYKYLEIKQRAEKFFRIFTEYFHSTNVFIPDIVPIEEDFKTYLKLLILKRYTLSECLKQLPNVWSKPIKRYEIITHNMSMLQCSSYYQSSNLYQIILDFDRWNNFRILPPNLQEPSPYKRRLKNEMKTKINNMLNMPHCLLNKVIDSYCLSDVTVGDNVLFMPICKISMVDKSKLISRVFVVDNSDHTISEISNRGLYLFKTLEECNIYINNIQSLFKEGKRSVVFGQQFWPEYRKSIHNSVNLTLVNNIGKDRDLDWFN